MLLKGPWVSIRLVISNPVLQGSRWFFPPLFDKCVLMSWFCSLIIQILFWLHSMNIICNWWVHTGQEPGTILLLLASQRTVFDHVTNVWDKVRLLVHWLDMKSEKKHMDQMTNDRNNLLELLGGCFEDTMGVLIRKPEANSNLETCIAHLCYEAHHWLQ